MKYVKRIVPPTPQEQGYIMFIPENLAEQFDQLPPHSLFKAYLAEVIIRDDCAVMKNRLSQ